METTSFIFDNSYILKGHIVRDVSNVVKLVAANNTDVVAYKVETTGFNNNKPVYSAVFYCSEEDLPKEDREHAIVKKI